MLFSFFVAFVNICRHWKIGWDGFPGGMRFMNFVNAVFVISAFLCSSALHSEPQSITATAQTTPLQESGGISQPVFATTNAGIAPIPTVDHGRPQDVSLGFDAGEIPSFDLAYERQVFGDDSIRFRATYGILGNDYDSINAGDDYYYDTYDTNVFGLGIGWFYYFTKNRDLRGWNIGPELSVYDLHNENSTQLSSDAYLFSLGLFGGYQWIIGSHVLLSTRIGIVRDVLADDLTNNNDPGLAPSDYNGWAYDFEILNLGWAFDTGQGNEEAPPIAQDDADGHPSPIKPGATSPANGAPSGNPVPSIIYSAGTEGGIAQGMLPQVDSSRYYLGWLADRAWVHLNESQVNNSEGLFDGVYVKAEIQGHFTLGIGQRNYTFGQSSAVATGSSFNGVYWIQINETLTGNAQEYYSMFGTPHLHLSKNLKIFANSEVGFINTTINDSTDVTGYNGDGIGQFITIGASSTSLEYGLVGGLEWDFLRHVALSANLGYQMFTPHTTTVTSVTTNAGILNSSSRTQSNLRNADGSNLNIDFTGLTGSLDVAWTW